MTRSELAATPRRGRPPATDSAGTRRRILDFARLAFARRGFDAATNRHFTAEAGLTSGSIYHYFGSKLDLYLAVYEDAQERVHARFTEAIRQATTFRGQMAAVLEVAYDLNREDPTLAQFLGSVRVDTQRDPALLQAFPESMTYRADFWRSIIDVGVATGEIDPADRETVEAVVATLLVGLTDAVSGSVEHHRRAIDGINALIAGRLIGPPRRADGDDGDDGEECDDGTPV